MIELMNYRIGGFVVLEIIVCQRKHGSALSPLRRIPYEGTVVLCGDILVSRKAYEGRVVILCNANKMVKFTMGRFLCETSRIIYYEDATSLCLRFSGLAGFLTP